MGPINPHSNKRVQIEGKFFLFFFPLFVGRRDKGRRFLLQGLSQLQTSSYLLVGSWFMIFISRPYYHPLLLPCGTRVVIIEMWPHSPPPCGRLLRNVVILLEMCHLAFPKGTYVLSFSILTSSLYWSFGSIKFINNWWSLHAMLLTYLPYTFILMLLYISIPSFLDSPAIFRASFFLITQEKICFLKCLLAKKAKS